MTVRRKPPKVRPGSNGCKTAKKQVAKLHKKVARQRQDTARTWAKSSFATTTPLAVEDLQPIFLAKTTLARKAVDAAISATKTALIDMRQSRANAGASAHRTAGRRDRATLDEPRLVRDHAGKSGPRPACSPELILWRIADQIVVGSAHARNPAPPRIARAWSPSPHGPGR